MDRLEALLEFHRLDPNDAFTRFAIAQEYLKRGDTGNALSTFEQLVVDHPDYVGTYYHLGKLYRQLDRPDDADDAFRAGIAAATRTGDHHARSELQHALAEANGIGFDE